MLGTEGRNSSIWTANSQGRINEFPFCSTFVTEETEDFTPWSVFFFLFHVNKYGQIKAWTQNEMKRSQEMIILMGVGYFSCHLLCSCAGD